MSVLLKKSPFKGIAPKELAQQIEAKKKCANKLPLWYSTPKIYYPEKLNIEQASSEITAQYKMKIVTGKSLIDTTGGFGVDSYFFSKKIDHVTHCEIDEELSKIVAYNFKILDTTNVNALSIDGLDFLKNSEQKFDWIYIDPSRRNEAKGKVFMLSDCLPNVVENVTLLLSRSPNVLIKTSPLLDFSAGLKELQYVKDIHVVSVNNEVKELLWVLQHEYSGEVNCKTINLKRPTHETFDFQLGDEKNALSSFSMPLKYLFEPNAAVMKSGGFKVIGKRFSLKKLHKHTHLYTSEDLIEFPGRIFKINKIFPYNKKTRQSMGIKQANISTRNFPESVVTIRKKFKIKDGGALYLFFTKDLNGNLLVLQCEKKSCKNWF